MLKILFLISIFFLPTSAYAMDQCTALNSAIKKLGYKRIIKEAEKRGYSEADVKYYINYCSKGKQ